MIADMIGDGSYLAILDAGRYASFVGSDWYENDRLLEPHFVEQMRRNVALVWDTGLETDWRLEIREAFSSDRGFREVVGSIESSNGTLCLVNYDSLSMAAQFADQRLPDASSKELLLAPGIYKFRVIQVIDPRDRTSLTEQFDAGGANFVLEYERTDRPLTAWTEVPWSRL